MTTPATDAAFLDCDWLLADPGAEPARRDVRVGLGERARRLRRGRLGAVQRPPHGWRCPRWPTPTTMRAPSRSATLGAFNQPLESWLPFLGVVPGMDPYLCAATSFARSLRNGVVDLMVHYTRVQGGMPYVDEAARRGTRRARRGRAHRLRGGSMRDRNGIAYSDDAHGAGGVAARHPRRGRASGSP